MEHDKHIISGPAAWTTDGNVTTIVHWPKGRARGLTRRGVVPLRGIAHDGHGAQDYHEIAPKTVGQEHALHLQVGEWCAGGDPS